ncbi:glutathione S-transferase [Saccharobesus litoralis]|uniref:Glutathione S-transferase n=1 Tax=Saccharobesus litoralis TaxID=2172099 RepID=A0A2S0VQU9_9ALTE|nr:glutathione S-transferase [Saccharobesus litoralis]AWB66595.1 glutathione S-transferase [Saccharobesus litoralis]
MVAIKLYTFPLSGHAHRVHVFLSLLGLDFELVNVDLPGGEHKQPAFLTKNPFGQVPAIDDGDLSLADSNAILLYLANKYDESGEWSPQEPAAAARVQQFLSLAAGKVAYGPAAARLCTLFGAKMDHQQAITMAHAVLTELEAYLEGKDWLVGDKPTIADVANYTYIAHAPEGDVSLQDYANIRAWLARFEALPGFVPMQKSAVGLAA